LHESRIEHSGHYGLVLPNTLTKDFVALNLSGNTDGNIVIENY